MKRFFSGLLTVLLLAAMWWALSRATAPIRSLLLALAVTTSSYRDGEFNFGVHWRGHDEFAQLGQAHAELGDVLREQLAPNEWAGVALVALGIVLLCTQLA